MVKFMAIVNGILVPKARKSAGNLTFRTVGGVTIFSEKVTKNPSSSGLQVKQRSNFKKVQEFAPLVAAIGRITQKRDKNRSTYNVLYKALYGGILNAGLALEETGNGFFGDLSSGTGLASPYCLAATYGTNLPHAFVGTISPLAYAVTPREVDSKSVCQISMLCYVGDADIYERIKSASEGTLTRLSISRGVPSVSLTKMTYFDGKDGKWEETPQDDFSVVEEGEFLRVTFTVFVSTDSSKTANDIASLYALRGLHRLMLNGVTFAMPWPWT